MKLLPRYLRQKITILIVYAIFCSVFGIIFYMYHLPIQAVIYPSLICVFLGSIFFLIDFLRFRQKHLLLKDLKKSSVNLLDNLPEISTVQDADYQNIITLLCGEQNLIRTDMSNKYDAMIHYYTVWVHQIKTPIASMHLSIQNEDTVFSRKLSRELFRIDQYVEMVLIYLRLNSDSTDYLIKEYNIDTIIKQSIKRFSSEFIEKKINLIYNSIDCNITTDEKWFSFLIEQILSNALKYTKKGFIKISINNQILSIEDSGIGISKEDLPRIFENGYTGYTGRVEKQASGIGLYLCKTICSQLNHTISVTSEIGKGTTIHINLSQYKLHTE